MIRELRAHDAEACVALRRQALLDSPLAFAASPADDVGSSLEGVREQLRRATDWFIFGAFEPELIGSVGLSRDRHRKASHKVHLWGMYVAPSHRRRGIGAELVRAAIRQARALPGVEWVHLAVSSAAPEAQRLYERLGFEVWGTEPDALRHDGRVVSEHHMSLRLELEGAARIES